MNWGIKTKQIGEKCKFEATSGTRGIRAVSVELTATTGRYASSAINGVPDHFRTAADCARRADLPDLSINSDYQSHGVGKRALLNDTVVGIRVTYRGPFLNGPCSPDEAAAEHAFNAISSEVERMASSQ